MDFLSNLLIIDVLKFKILFTLNKASGQLSLYKSKSREDIVYFLKTEDALRIRGSVLFSSVLLTHFLLYNNK